MNELQFTTDWTTNNAPIWREHLKHLIEKPKMLGLEVGTWEGRSTAWLLEHIVCGPGASLITVDRDHSRFNHNCALLEERFPNRLHVVTGDAKAWLLRRSAHPHDFDFIYLDAPKDAAEVLAQTVLCWEVLKPGGILIFDDYQWPGKDNNGFENPPRHYSNPPRIAIDAFLTANYLNFELLHAGWQKIVRKK